jgi:hypothetical protein
MTSDEATAAARRHLQENPFPEQGFRWALDPGTRLPEGWYFEYRFERAQGTGDLPLYAGAKGFIVLPDGHVREVSWPEWQKLRPARG